MLISASSLPDNLFTDKALVVLCSLNNKNEIETVTLLDTGATGVTFIDKAMVRHVYDTNFFHSVSKT